MILRTAFNALTKLHSRQATLKRLGNTTIYSPIKITPSNFFRFLRGPEYTTISGHEFIIPIDSMAGHFSQKLSFAEIPTLGFFSIQFGGNTTDPISFNATAVDIQDELRDLAGLTSVVVTGSFATGFIITFVGFEVQPALGIVTASTLDTATTMAQTSLKWDELIKKGDRIIDGSKLYAVDEIVDMHDVGATVMGYRVRCD